MPVIVRRAGSGSVRAAALLVFASPVLKAPMLWIGS